MAKKEKKQSSGEGVPAWLVTFSDMMTLLLTFFVLLLSMASLTDERKIKVVLGSIIGSFGIGTKGVDVLSGDKGGKVGEPGPMEDVVDLAALKPLLWDEKDKDLNFIANRFIQIVEINSAVLFEPGKTQLTAQGKELLSKLIPILKKVDYPLALRSHTSTLRDEFGPEFLKLQENSGLDLSWKLSLGRLLSVYRYLLEQGLNPENIRVEAFGRFRPRYPETRAQGREKNRRVEIVLDKRVSSWAVEEIAQFKVRKPVEKDKFIYKDFIFDLNNTR